MRPYVVEMDVASDTVSLDMDVVSNEVGLDMEVGSGTGGSYVLRPATRSTLGGIIVGDDLLITAEGVLSVDKASAVEQDNTKPITAAAVYTEVGNINAILQTI